MNHLNNCHGNITTGNYSNARQNFLFYKKCSFYNRRTPFTFVNNIIRTSQHGISLSVIEIISNSHVNFKRYFSLFVLSEFLFLKEAEMHEEEWTNTYVYQLDVSWLLASPIFASFGVLDFKNRNFFLAGRTV